MQTRINVYLDSLGRAVVTKDIVADNQPRLILPQPKTPRIIRLVKVHDGVNRVGPRGPDPKFESARLIDGLPSRRIKRHLAEDDAAPGEANAIGLSEPRDAVVRKGIKGPKRAKKYTQRR